MSLVALLLVFPPLGQRVITTSDEARFPLLARDMIERGTWFNANVRGQLYRNKPPLYAWSIAALSRASGRVTEAAAQAPIAIAAVAAILFTFLLGDRLFGWRAGVPAGLILATSYGFFEHSQKLLPDMIVVAFAAAAGYAFWRSVSEPPGRPMLAVFYAAVAFGVFAKGPLGLLPVLVAIAWLWTEHGLKGLRHLWSSVGVAIFGAVTVIWLGPFIALGSQSFASTVVWQDWLTWYVGFPDPSRLLNTSLDAILGFTPWTFLLLLPLTYIRQHWRNGAPRFVFLTFVVPLVVVMLSQNQRARYLLTVYPGAALLVAWWAHAHGTARTATARRVGWVAALGVVVTGSVLAFVWLEASLLQLVPGLGWQVFALVAGAALVGGLMFWTLRAGKPLLLVTGVATVMALLLASGIWIHNAWVNNTQDYRRLAAGVERYRQNGEVQVFGGRFLPLDFYLGRQLARIRTVEQFNQYVARPERPLVVVNERTWGLIQGQISPRVRPLEITRIRGQEMLIVRADRS